MEATCLGIADVADATGLSEDWEESGSFNLLTAEIWTRCGDKVEQCAARPEVPTLVAVGTLHERASFMCLCRERARSIVTGRQGFGFAVSPETGDRVGPVYATGDVGSASFFVVGRDGGLEAVRRDIAGLLVCGLRIVRGEIGDQGEIPGVTGVLHPDPFRSFDPKWLPRLRFDSQVREFRRGPIEFQAPDAEV